MYTYNQIRQLAISRGVADNKVSIGIFAKLQGYVKIKKQINKERKIYYILEKL